MKLMSSLLIAATAAIQPMAAQIVFDGTSDAPVTVSAPASSGLNAIYVVKSADGVSLSCENGKNAKWSRFGSAGAAYASEPVESQSFIPGDDDTGVAVELDGVCRYYWIVNYANHGLEFNSLAVNSELSDCSRTALDFNGKADKITYYTINGRPMELDREITLSYNTLAYNQEKNVYETVAIETTLPALQPVLRVDAPLCETSFTLSGDRFLENWHESRTLVSGDVAAQAVAAETSAEQTARDVANEQTSAGVALGGSAPCDITFSAITTDAASFYEWQLSKMSDFDVIDDRYPQSEMTYTFREHGTTYVRFFAADASDRCEYYSPVYEVSIGESSLLCPNVFSPDASPGVNDEWRVSYKSIVSFECHIFNRWGSELFSFSDPAQGWDGRHGGKIVPAGVYYYVIKARGADGRVYNLSGDINIIGSKSTNYTNDSQY